MSASVGELTIKLKPSRALSELLGTVGEICTDLNTAICLLEANTKDDLSDKDRELFNALMRKYGD